MLRCQTFFRAVPEYLGDQFLSSAGAGGNCACPMRLQDPSPVLEKNHAPTRPEIISSTGAGGLEKGSYGISRLSVCEYWWLSRLGLGTALNQGPPVFPITLPTVLGATLRLSTNTVGSPNLFQEWLQIKAHRFSQSLF